MTKEIPNTEYITITDTDVFVGGAPAREYNGQKIYNHYLLPGYFKYGRDAYRDEHNIELLELHCLQSGTGGELCKPGDPTPDKDGCYCWYRIKYRDMDGNEKISPWVFAGYSHASLCAYRCAYYCGARVRNGAVFRAALFVSSGD